MQTQAKTAPTPPTAPSIIVERPGGTDVIRLPGPALSAQDLAVLKARREELSNQLISVDGRRTKLLSQLDKTTDETARKGLADRIALLDKRQLQLETDLAETGRELSSAPAGLIATTSDADNIFRSVDSAAGPVATGMFIVFVLGPLAVGAARMMWKRSNRPGPPPAAFTETAQRMERLEQSIDAIALEIERVSEGQRFVTKLLSDAQPGLIGSGQRAPDSVKAAK